jgi:hypothetical protein
MIPPKFFFKKTLSLSEGKPIKECRRLAESTMTVILGRLSAYTGRA